MVVKIYENKMKEMDDEPVGSKAFVFRIAVHEDEVNLGRRRLFTCRHEMRFLISGCRVVC